LVARHFDTVEIHIENSVSWVPEKKNASPAPLRPVSNKEPIPEFNKYSSSYSRLLDDPIRNRFAPDSCFFFERKWFLLHQFWEHLGRDPLQARWLDFGCGKGDLLRFGQNYFSEVVGCDVADGMLQDCTGAVRGWRFASKNRRCEFPLLMAAST
jgi:SAM-dependent methyltransferase